MKKLFSILFCVALVSLFTNAHAQQVPAPNSMDIGLFNSPVGSNRFEIRIRPLVNINGASGISACIFTVRFPVTYNITMALTSPASPIAAGLYQHINNGSNRYATFGVAGNPIPVNWPAGVEQVVVAFTHNNPGPSGSTGTFVLGNDAFTAANNLDYYIEYEGTDAQNNIYQPIAASVPLPVNLLDFTARKVNESEVDLQWDAVERNFSHYEIEASRGENDKFARIGNQKGLSSPNKSSYFFKDKNPVNGVNFYRLKMVDLDGRFEYSPVTSVEIERAFVPYYEVFPNPTSGPVTVAFNSENEGITNLEIQTLEGRFVKTIEMTGVKGSNQIPMDIELANGVYNLVFKVDGKQVQVKRLIVAE
jgi:hypothetical protein